MQVINFCYRGRIKGEPRSSVIITRTEHSSKYGKIHQFGRCCKIFLAQTPYVCGSNTDPSLAICNLRKHCISFQRISASDQLSQSYAAQGKFTAPELGKCCGAMTNTGSSAKIECSHSRHPQDRGRRAVVVEQLKNARCSKLKNVEMAELFNKAIKNDILTTSAIKNAQSWKRSSKKHVDHRTHSILMT